MILPLVVVFLSLCIPFYAFCFFLLKAQKRLLYDSLFLCFQLDSETLVTGKAAIGNMLGGIGYFYGQSKIHVPKSALVSFSSLTFCAPKKIHKS